MTGKRVGPGPPPLEASNVQWVLASAFHNEQPKVFKASVEAAREVAGKLRAHPYFISQKRWVSTLIVHHVPV